MKRIKDDIFGNMEYDCSWVKKEQISLFGKSYEVRIVAKAYTGQEVSDTQRASYTCYQKNFQLYIEQIPNILLTYYLDNYNQIAEYVDIPEKINRKNITEELIVKLIKVQTVYFDRKGNFGWLCDCAWDREHGISIILSADKPIVTEQEELI